MPARCCPCGTCSPVAPVFPMAAVPPWHVLLPDTVSLLALSASLQLLPLLHLFMWCSFPWGTSGFPEVLPVSPLCFFPWGYFWFPFGLGWSIPAVERTRNASTCTPQKRTSSRSSLPYGGGAGLVGERERAWPGVLHILKLDEKKYPKLTTTKVPFPPIAMESIARVIKRGPSYNSAGITVLPAAAFVYAVSAVVFCLCCRPCDLLRPCLMLSPF